MLAIYGDYLPWRLINYAYAYVFNICIYIIFTYIYVMIKYNHASGTSMGF